MRTLRSSFYFAAVQEAPHCGQLFVLRSCLVGCDCSVYLFITVSASATHAKPHSNSSIIFHPLRTKLLCSKWSSATCSGTPAEFTCHTVPPQWHPPIWTAISYGAKCTINVHVYANINIPLHYYIRCSGTSTNTHAARMF